MPPPKNGDRPLFLGEIGVCPHFWGVCPYFLVAFCILTSVFCLLPSYASTSYDLAISQLDNIEKSPYVRVLPQGHSPQGRPLNAILVSDFQTSPARKARVLICAGQHGDEPNAVFGLTNFLRDLIGRRDASSLLQKCVLIIIPIVNPDGMAANSRTNAKGADVNRDWMSLSTREAQFVDGLIGQWQPNIILDLHEWKQHTSVPGDEIEVFLTGSRARSALSRAVALRIGRTAGLKMLQCASARRDLLHRRFPNEGYASYLVETAYNKSPDEKCAIYKAALYSTVEAACEASSGTLSVLSPGSNRFDAPTVARYMAPKIIKGLPKPVNIPIFSVVMSALGYLIMARLAHRNRRKTQEPYRVRVIRRGYDPDPTRRSPFSVRAQPATPDEEQTERNEGTEVFQLPLDRHSTRHHSPKTVTVRKDVNHPASA